MKLKADTNIFICSTHVDLWTLLSGEYLNKLAGVRSVFDFGSLESSC